MMATDVAPDAARRGPEGRVRLRRPAAGDVPDRPRRLLDQRPGRSSRRRPTEPPSTAALDNLVADGGTALGDAIATVARRAPRSLTGRTPAAGHRAPSSSAAPSSSPSASGSPSTSAEPPLVATVLLSDGKNSTGGCEPLDAAPGGRPAGVPIYTIALGTQRRRRPGPRPTQGQLRTVEVPPDTETLAAIAETTGGAVLRGADRQDLAQIYQSLGSRVGFTYEQQEVTQLFAAAGLLFVARRRGARRPLVQPLPVRVDRGPTSRPRSARGTRLRRRENATDRSAHRRLFRRPHRPFDTVPGDVHDMG